MTLSITLVCCALVPLTMLLCGVWMLRRPPKDINHLLGYRTRRSMKNQQTWDFAHRMCGKVWTIGGAAMLLPSVIVPILVQRGDPDRDAALLQVLTGVQIVVLLLSVWPVERALRRHFDDNGNPKE